MNLDSSVDTIYNELSVRQDCLNWLHERTGSNWYVITTREGYAFELVRYLDTDLGYHNGLAPFNVFLFQSIDNREIKNAIRSFVRNLYVAVNRLYRDECGQNLA